MPRTICVVNPFEHGGGAEYQLSLLTAELAARPGWSVHYVTHFDHPGQARCYAISRVGDGGPIPRLGYLMEARQLCRTLAAIGPEVIYQRVACGYTGIAAWFARRASIRMVWHVSHDTDVTPEWLDGGRNVLRNWLEKRAVRFGARNASQIVVQTHRQDALLRRHYRREASAVIPNFHPPAGNLAEKPDAITVLWVANLKPWKRPEMFVRLARALQSLQGVRFVMVGAGAGAANRRWESVLLDDIRSSGNLEYVGRKTQGEVEAMLARAHIFVNTSAHEGFPNTFIQAWLRGAVVVSLGIDPDDVLAQRRVGIAARDEADLAAAVRGLIENARQRHELAGRARSHALAHHSLDNARLLADLLLSRVNAEDRSPVR